MVGLTHDQRRCIASVVLRQGYTSIYDEGINPTLWPRPEVPLPPEGALTSVLNSWHQQMLHLADLAS